MGWDIFRFFFAFVLLYDISGLVRFLKIGSVGVTFKGIAGTEGKKEKRGKDGQFLI